MGWGESGVDVYIDFRVGMAYCFFKYNTKAPDFEIWYQDWSLQVYKYVMSLRKEKLEYQIKINLICHVSWGKNNFGCAKILPLGQILGRFSFWSRCDVDMRVGDARLDFFLGDLHWRTRVGLCYKDEVIIPEGDVWWCRPPIAPRHKRGRLWCLVT